MLKTWLRYLFWRPFAVLCRQYPLVPLRAQVTHPVDGVTCIRIENSVTRCLSRFSGGYAYAVCYLIDETLLVDTGFSWAKRCLRQTLMALGADKTITTVVNTHYHEDHSGNNDLLVAMTGARILAHPVAIPKMRFLEDMPWYRHFLFGPTPPGEVAAIPEHLETKRFRFEVHHMPGHCPGHLCLYEPERRWLFSGDLYIAADLDSQLADADGPAWIASLDKALALGPECLFDAHGTILTDRTAVTTLLQRKRDFLVEIRQRVYAAAAQAQTLRELTQKVFSRCDLVDSLSFSEGWLALITGSDFSRAHVIKSFLQAVPADQDSP